MPFPHLINLIRCMEREMLLLITQGPITQYYGAIHWSDLLAVQDGLSKGYFSCDILKECFALFPPPPFTL